MSEGVVEGVSGRGLEAVVYKACAFTRASPEEQRVKDEQPRSVLSPFPFVVPTCRPPASSGNMSKNLHPTMDPTKMGLGRSIAVLTSGGDAQGKQRMRLQCLITALVQNVKTQNESEEAKAAGTASSLLM